MKIWTIALVLTVPVVASLAAGQTADRVEVLLKATMHQELVDGDLQAAIEQYEDIVARSGGNRAVAAKALLQMGRAYEKLGRSEASAAYERVLREYAEQREPAAEARARLAALAEPVRAAEPTALVMRRVWVVPTERDIEGAVSSDGRYVPLDDEVTGDLVVRDLVNGEDIRLTHNQVPREHGDHGDAAISRDSKWVAYSWHNPDGSTELRVSALAEGARPRLLYRHQDVVDIDPFGWTPDGTQILARFRRADRTWQIAMVSVADGSERVLKSVGWSDYPRLYLSPDGRYIAYDIAPQGASADSILVLASDGSSETPLVEGPFDDDVIGWTPDGKGILFSRDESPGDDDGKDLWLARVSDGKPQGSPEVVRRNIGVIRGVRGITERGAFYYETRDARVDLYLATLDPATGEVVAPPRRLLQRSVGPNPAPEWSPDGKYLAYFASSSQPSPSDPNTGRIRIRSVESGEERTLSPKNMEFGRSRGGPTPHWSPDGRSLLVRGGSRGRGGSLREALYQVDVETGEATQILALARGTYFGGVGWSGDGRAVFYTSNRHEITWRSLETGQETEIYRDQLMRYTLVLSPDGERLAFFARSRPQATAVRTIPVTGGEPRTLIDAEEPNLLSAPAWTPDGRHFLFVKRDAERRGDRRARSQFWRVPAEGGEPQPLQLTIDGVVRKLTVHPDGRRIVFTASQPSVELWVMENFLPPLSQ